MFISFKKSEVVEEPALNDEGVSIIKFREPHSGKTFSWRFLRSHTIQNLYDFVYSKLDEVEFEEEHHMQFELVQNVPFKVFNDPEWSLDEEGLFPGAQLQIRDTTDD